MIVVSQQYIVMKSLPDFLRRKGYVENLTDHYDGSYACSRRKGDETFLPRYPFSYMILPSAVLDISLDFFNGFVGLYDHPFYFQLVQQQKDVGDMAQWNGLAQVDMDLLQVLHVLNGSADLSPNGRPVQGSESMIVLGVVQSPVEFQADADASDGVHKKRR